MKLSGVKHYESKVIKKYAEGGAVQRSESTEAAKADRKVEDRYADYKNAKQGIKDANNMADVRVQSALVDRAVERSQTARDRANETARRTGYTGADRMGDKAAESIYPPSRLRNSPVTIGIGDDD